MRHSPTILQMSRRFSLSHTMLSQIAVTTHATVCCGNSCNCKVVSVVLLRHGSAWRSDHDRTTKQSKKKHSNDDNNMAGAQLLVPGIAHSTRFFVDAFRQQQDTAIQRDLRWMKNKLEIACFWRAGRGLELLNVKSSRDRCLFKKASIRVDENSRIMRQKRGGRAERGGTTERWKEDSRRSNAIAQFALLLAAHSHASAAVETAMAVSAVVWLWPSRPGTGSPWPIARRMQTGCCCR